MQVADNQIGSLDALSLCGHHYPLTIVNTYKPLSKDPHIPNSPSGCGCSHRGLYVFTHNGNQ